MPRDDRRRPPGRVMGAYGAMTRVLALLTIALGLMMLLFTATHGGGIGLLLGALFVAAGAGRLYLARRRG